eukprot:Phypoly_transcript_11463.p1 GENE.Phypoly_transcript_11463~~Phypoly_transcript_11463.p1  ORF type:complete len:306 (+),score=41.80 Phypoly_transcript_11463:49-966(+)
MGTKPTSPTGDPAWMKFLFGGLSCMTAACVTNPIDVIKTRLQLQGQLSKHHDPHYKGFIRGSIQIVVDEGIFGLYKGLSPSVLREATYSTLRMGGYDVMKTYLNATDPKHTPLWKKLLAGATSGAFGAALANPADLVKVRMQAQAKAGGHQYSGLTDAFSSIYHKEGLRGLYKGVWPSTQRAALLTATQLACYDHIKHFLLNSNIGLSDNILTHFCSSVVAGFFAAAVTSPFDVVKSRIMNQHTAPGSPPLYTGTLDCFAKTIKSEGFYGLYKGFIPNWMRIGPHTIVTFIVYEQLRKLGGLKPI